MLGDQLNSTEWTWNETQLNKKVIGYMRSFSNWGKAIQPLFILLRIIILLNHHLFVLADGSKLMVEAIRCDTLAPGGERSCFGRVDAKHRYAHCPTASHGL